MYLLIQHNKEMLECHPDSDTWWVGSGTVELRRRAAPIILAAHAQRNSTPGSTHARN